MMAFVPAACRPVPGARRAYACAPVAIPAADNRPKTVTLSRESLGARLPARAGCMARAGCSGGNGCPYKWVSVYGAVTAAGVRMQGWHLM